MPLIYIIAVTAPGQDVSARLVRRCTVDGLCLGKGQVELRMHLDFEDKLGDVREINRVKLKTK